MLYNPDIFTIIFCETEESKNVILKYLDIYIKEYQEINIPESGPKIIKSLPSEKVYSMISNKNQETNEDREDGEMTPTPEKLEEMRENNKLNTNISEVNETKNAEVIF